MFRILRLITAAILIAAFANATNADDPAVWSIVQATGKIWIRAGGAEAVSLGNTRTIAPGTTLATSASGRALLKRGEETMIVGPNTIMQVPPGSSRLFTTVIEVTGIVEFDVEKRNVRHFAVQTPNLAAIVKGTHFSVQAGTGGDTVAVTRGIVEVESLATGKKMDVRAGQRVEISSDGDAVFSGAQRADAGTGDVDTASAGSQGPGGISLGVGGGNGISASIGGGNGVSAQVSAAAMASAQVSAALTASAPASAAATACP